MTTINQLVRKPRRIKKEKKEAKKLKPKKSFEPHFPRDKQLE